MSVEKHRLDAVGTVRENGYDWKVVECPECGEEVQQRHIEDDGQWYEDDYREDVCPACNEEIEVESNAPTIEMPNIQSVDSFS